MNSSRARSAEAKRHKRATPHRAAKLTQAAVAPKKASLTPLETAVLRKPIESVPVAAIAQENDDETPGARRKK